MIPGHKRVIAAPAERINLAAKSFKTPNVLAESDHPTRDHAVPPVALGPLETQVMEILWTCGECKVRDVMKALDRDLAYTTVMTTLVRLFGKKLVSRRKRARAYFYLPCVTCQEWADAAAREWIDKLMAGPKISRELLIECLMKAVGHQDANVADGIARTAREKSGRLVKSRPKKIRRSFT